MAEYEELRLSVVLDDQATPQVERIKKSFTGLGDTPVVQGYQKLQANGIELNRTVSTLTKGMGGLGEAATVSVGALTSVAGAIAAVGTVIGLEIKKLNDYANAQERLGHLSRVTGIAPAQLKEMTETMERFGVSHEKAEETAAGLAGSMGDILKRNSELRQSLLRGQDDPVSRANMEQRIGQLMSAAAHNNAALFGNIVRQMGDEVYEGNLARYGSVERAAAARMSFLAQRFHAGGLVDVEDDFEERTDEENAHAQKRIDDAKALHRVVWDIQKSFDSLGNRFQETVLPEITRMVEGIGDSISDWAEDIDEEDMQKFVDSLKTVADSLRTIGQVLKAVFDAGNAFAQWWDSHTRGKDAPGVRANRWLRSLPGMGWIPDASQPETPEEKDQDFGKKLDTYINRIPGAKWLNETFRPQRPGEVGPGAAPIPFVTPLGAPAFAEPPDHEAIMRAFRARQILFPQHPELDRARQFTPPPAPPAPPPTQGGGWLPRWFRPGGLAPATAPGTPQRFTGGGEEATDEEMAAALADPKWANRIPDIGSAMRGGVWAPDIPIQPVGTDKQWFDTIGFMSYLAGGSGAFLGAAYRGLGLGAAGGRPVWEPPAETAPAAGAGAAATYPTHEWLAAINPMTGRTRSAAEMVSGRSGSWDDIDRGSLISAMRSSITHKVEGSGKLTVDVNAPPGTEVGAEGDGIFKEIDLNRQMQMERAASTVRRPLVYGPR